MDSVTPLLAAPLDVWEAETARCNPEDLVDLTDQISLLDSPRREEVAQSVQAQFILRREAGEIPEEIAGFVGGKLALQSVGVNGDWYI